MFLVKWQRRKRKGKDADKAKIKYYEKLAKSVAKATPASYTVYPFFAAIGSCNKVIIDQLVSRKVNFGFVGEDGLSAIGKYVMSVRTAEVFILYSINPTALETRGYKVPEWYHLLIRLSITLRQKF